MMKEDKNKAKHRDFEVLKRYLKKLTYRNWDISKQWYKSYPSYIENIHKNVSFT